MTDSTRLGHLRLALRVLGVVLIFGIYPLTIVWPSGWAWHAMGSSHYLQMIIGLYATLGVFLLIASKAPNDHLSLISFTIWSSVVHGGIMSVQSVMNPEHIGHLYGDVLALFAVALVLGALCPAAAMLRFDKA